MRIDGQESEKNTRGEGEGVLRVVRAGGWMVGGQLLGGTNVLRGYPFVLSLDI
jgi:hypothetical protein